jgi:hypothetical protein
VSCQFKSTALAALLCSILSACTTPPPPVPKLGAVQLTLAPHSTAGKVDYVEVALRLEKPNVAAGGKLAQLPLIIVSIPTVRYDGNALTASDARGELLLTAVDQPPTPTMTVRQWSVNRATEGDVLVRARALPRAVSAATRNGPLFDLREENGSMNGAGHTFIPLPDWPGKFRIRLRWDLSGMPPGSRGVWSLGEGNVDVVDTIDTLASTFYAAGPVLRHPANGTGPFSMVWFSPTPFDASQVASGIETFFKFAARFFEDGGGSYRVFVRRNPYPAGGGTALRRSFMFGWGVGRTQSNDDLQGLLAHEITHNWPRLDDTEHGATAWYSEGTAEYYSILLSRRAGAISDEEFLRRINGRASGYYTNPYRALSNADAAQKFWVDSRAQRVPYGRGFMYLATLDAQLRAVSGGRRSVDDLVLEVLRRQRAGETVGLKEWQTLVVRELGPAAQTDFDAMVAGRMLVPPPNSFAPCLRLEARSEKPLELGFDQFRPAVVSSLVPDSNAARAGLRDGDEIVEMTDSGKLAADETLEMTMTIRRGQEQRVVRYLPRGTAVESYRWVITAQPLSACKY